MSVPLAHVEVIVRKLKELRSKRRTGRTTNTICADFPHWARSYLTASCCGFAQLSFVYRFGGSPQSRHTAGGQLPAKVGFRE